MNSPLVWLRRLRAQLAADRERREAGLAAARARILERARAERADAEETGGDS